MGNPLIGEWGGQFILIHSQWNRSLVGDHHEFEHRPEYLPLVLPNSIETLSDLALRVNVPAIPAWPASG